MDSKYAYFQLTLNAENSRHCIFIIVSDEYTGAYRFITGFYGLTDIPQVFQKVEDNTLVRLKNTHCFIDDIIIISRGSKEDHLKLVYKCLKKLDEDKLLTSQKYVTNFEHFLKRTLNSYATMN